MQQTDPVWFERLPTALTERPQWVLWKYEQRGDKWTKVPYQPSGERASSTDPATWSTLAAVQEAKWRQMGTYHGVGFVFSPDDPFVGIDLDHCRGEWWAAELLDRFPTYIEITPSWTGYHLIGVGTLPDNKGRRKGPIEVYSAGRYFTMTGCLAPGSMAEPQAIQGPLDALLAELAPPKAERQTPGWTPSLDLHDVLRRSMLAKNGSKVQALYAGDRSGYASKSEADMALLECLTFYTQDAATLDAIFRSSALMDTKWDEQRGAQTYGALTISRVLANPSGHYGGRDRTPTITSLRTDPYAE